MAVNINQLHDEKATFGDRVADSVAALMGSWRFIIGQTIVVGVWVILNTWHGWALMWDSYPFILLNLLFSTQAAYAAPVIMMSQNRQAAKDRLAAEEDFRVNRRAESELVVIRQLILDIHTHMKGPK